jgi:ATP-dependent protease ClpP protease subunit
MEYIVAPNKLLEEMKINDYLKENTIYLDCEIDRESQVMFCRQLRKLALQELAKEEKERQPIKIKISSFGGWVCSVFAMVSYLEYWQEQGIIIETYCDGYTASGGSKILMAGSKGHRYMTRYGTVLFHQSNSYKQGHSTLQEDIKEVEESLKDWETLKNMIKKHTKITDEELLNYTEKNINFTYRPQDCLEKGIVDHII